MHTEIKYDSENPDDHERAINDIKEWLGEEQYHMINAQFIDAKEMATWPYFTGVCEMGGISGFPVKIWFENIVECRGEDESNV